MSEHRVVRKLTEREASILAPVIERLQQQRLQVAVTEQELARLCAAIEPRFVDGQLEFSPEKMAFTRAKKV